jgi:cell volume regulation protein A
MRPQIAGRIEADDRVYLFTAPRNIRLLDRLFASPAPVEEDDKDFFGAFYIDTNHTLAELAQAYGVEPPGEPATPIGIFMRERLGGQAEVGDRVPVGYLELIVRETDEDGAVTAAGLAVAPDPTPGPAAWPVVSGFVDFVEMARGWSQRLFRRGSGRSD